MTASDSPSSAVSKFFTIPAPIKQLFSRFPLTTLPANELPLRSLRAKQADAHALFIWTTDSDAIDGRASFNPVCLRWQAFLKAHDVSFYTVPSSNHASLSSRLPFIAVNAASKAPFKRDTLMSEGDIGRWASEQSDSWPKELENMYEAYTALVEKDLRRAWLYHMYLTSNFELLTQPQYIGTQSASWVVGAVNAWELKREARRELEKSMPNIDAETIYASAELALMSLDSVVRRKVKAAGVENPSVLEASLFGYLFLLLELPETKWADARLVQLVRKQANLVSWEKKAKDVFGALQPPAIYADL